MENKKFTKDDLKVGYVVRTRNGKLYMVMPSTGSGTVIVDNNCHWMPLNDYYPDLSVGSECNDDDFDIVEVYDSNMYGAYAMRLSTDYRVLLWEREPEKTCDDCAHKVVCQHVGMCEHFMAKAK